MVAGCGLDGLGQGGGEAASLASVVRGLALRGVATWRDVMAASRQPPLVSDRRPVLVGRRRSSARVKMLTNLGRVWASAQIWPVMVAVVLRRGVGPSQIWVGAKAFGPGSWLCSDGPGGFGPRFADTGPVKGFGM